MPVTVTLPGALHRHAGCREVEVEATTVGAALQAVVASRPGLDGRILSETGQLRPFVRVFVDGRLAELEEAVAAGSQLTLVPALSGGAELPPLSAAERARYGRHLLLDQVGETGQRKLKAARVLLIGAGGLGSPVALYLAAAGVGKLGLVDFDVVDLSNLQRQILFEDADVGRPKTQAALATLRARNPHIELVEHAVRLDASNAEAIAAGYDLIIDGADNFATRYLNNDLAVLTRKPLIYGAIFQFDGQVSVFAHGDGPCYRCLYPEPPPPELAPNCAEAGVLGVLPGLIGLIQATEALKIILGEGQVLAGRLLLIDALSMTFRELQVARNPECPVCGDHPTITGLADTAAFCAAFTDPPQSAWDVSVADFQAMRGQPHFLLDVRSQAEADAENLGGHLIPLDVLAERLEEIPREIKVIVHCQSGKRSARATELLRTAGHTDAWNLRGGLLAWKTFGPGHTEA